MKVARIHELPTLRRATGELGQPMRLTKCPGPRKFWMQSRIGARSVATFNSYGTLFLLRSKLA